ncbi:unnamed protein product, partial [Rotaria sp. Silwood2]
MSIVMSSKNKDQLLLDGFRYRRANKSKTIWRCCKNSCAGRVCFNGTTYDKVTDHNHASNPEEIISMESKSNIIKSATTSHDPPRRIIHEALLNVNKHDGTAVPNYYSCQRTIERKRKKKDIPLPRPTSLDEVHIPDELQITNCGDRFLLYDNQDANDRIIILSSDDDLDRLSNSDSWHCDGTFKIAPHLFHQLYTVHGRFCARTLPLVYCILSGKSEDIYHKMFDVVLNHVSQCPLSITVDFEKAVHNVIKQKLPQTKLNGCFFHYKQCLWRHVQTLGLQEPFNNDRQVQHSLKTFACLAFIPEQFVIEEFEKLQADAPDLIDDFVDYFEEYFIGRLVRNNRRRAPRFPIAIWNCFYRLDQQQARTNNGNEGWHRAILNSVRQSPSIYESIADLKMEQHGTFVMAEQLQTGQ